MTTKDPEIQDDLQRGIYEILMAFPGRIDEMETRSEDACRLLARQIAARVRESPRDRSAS